MKLLLDQRKLVIAIDNEIEFGTFEDEEKWKVGNMYYIDNNFTIVDIETVPLDVIPYKHFYIESEFILNPNWSNTPEDIANLQKENASLKSELGLLQEVVNEMLLGI